VVAPVSIAPAAAPAASEYQTIFDWLTQQTLISSVPNWIVAGGVALLAFKFMGEGKH
jgi:hypothetical protein